MPHPKVKLSDDSGNAVSVTGNRLDVNAHTVSGRLDVSLDSASGVHVDDAGFTLGTHAGLMMMGFAGTNSVDGNDAAALQCTTAGILKVDISGRYNSLPAGSQTIGKTDLQLAGTAIDGNSGDKSGGTLRIVIADDDPHFGAVGGSADADGSIHGQLLYLSNQLNSINTEVTTTDTNIGYLAACVKGEDVSHSNGDPGLMALVVRNDTLATLSGGDGDYSPLQVNATGALYTSHDITGGADGVKTVSSAGTDVVLGSDVACRKIDIQAQTDNTGLIAVGFTGVDATEATGTGVILYAGDTYSLETTNLNLIYIDSTVSGDGVRFTYFT